MGEFRMPSLGADMDVGTIIEWLVKPGDAVRRGQIVAVVDTAKAAIEIEAFEEGVVDGDPRRHRREGAGGDPAGDDRGLGQDGGHARPAGAPLPTLAVVDRPIRQPIAATAGARAPGAPPPHPRATPPVRHLAHQLGVDLDAVPGTGPDGHITHDDVLRAAPVTTGPAAAAAARRGDARPGDGAHPVSPRPDSRAFRHLESGRDCRWSAR